MTDPSSGDGDPGDGRSRAQLMLVGAVAIALIMMGLVVVFNTVLFTQAKPSTDSLDDASEAKSWTYQVQNETQELALRIYNATACQNSIGTSKFETYMKQNISTWSEVQSLSHAHTGPVYVQIELVQINGLSTSLDNLGDSEAVIEIQWRTENFRYRNKTTVPLPAPPEGDRDPRSATDCPPP